MARGMGAAEWVMLIALSVLWGGSFFFVEVALRELPPLTVVFFRVSLGAAALWIYAVATQSRIETDRTLWIQFAIMGTLNNAIPFTMMVWGQTFIGAGLASILNATTPLFTVVVAHFLTSDERMTAARLAGVVLGLLGVAILMGPDVFGDLDSGQLVGQAAILVGALSYAFAGVYGRRLSKHSPVVTAAGMLTASSIIILPMALLFEGIPKSVPGLDVLSAVVAIAILSSALAYILYFKILAAAGATNLLLVTFLIPVSAIVLGVWFLAEKLTVEAMLGMLVIFCGLACVDGRLFGYLRTLGRSAPDRG